MIAPGSISKVFITTVAAAAHAVLRIPTRLDGTREAAPASLAADFSIRERRFRTIQVRPKDFPAMPRQSQTAAPASFVGDLTMSERVIDERQGWTSDIIGVGLGLGLYSVLFLLVTFLCIYTPA